jgi:hypothetical protein
MRAFPMFLADLLGKEDHPFVAAHFSPAVSGNPCGILLFGFAVGSHTLVFDFFQYRHPVVAIRFDRKDVAPTLERYPETRSP